MTSIAVPAESRHFMAHPEVEAYLRGLFPSLTAESDRGAVLLGAAQIDEQLKLLFASLAPAATSKNRKKEIFSFNGPFGSFSAKLDVAYVCRLLPPSLIDAVHRFRKLRNDVAHKASSFELKDHQDEIYRIFALVGPGVDVGVNRMTVELMVNNMLIRLTTADHPIDEGKPLFENRSAALAYLDENKHVLKVLEADRPRWELGVGVGLICGLIIHHRERLSRALGSSETIVSALRKDSHPHVADA